MTKKEQEGRVRINHSGVQKIMVYPKTRPGGRYAFKGLELVPAEL
jgi:hypothetical protein